MTRKSTFRHSFQSYQSLEPRQLLAGIAFNSGQVVVNGNATADLIQLIGSSDFQSFTVRINNDPALTESFAYSDVTRLTVNAGDGNDRVINTLVLDTFIFGGGGNDFLQGGYRNDQLSGGDGVDRLIGRNGNDTLRGDGGSDSLFAGNGDDVLDGGLGNDNLIGSLGDDFLNGNDGNDRINAGLGDDTVNGGFGDDIISGVDGANRLNGDDGNDTIFGGEINDIINGGRGDDFLVGGNGDDSLNGNDGIDRLLGGFGDDRISGGDGDDSLFGQQGDDILIGDSGNDLLAGFDGDDVFFTSAGNDNIRGGDGVDRVRYLADQFEIQVTPIGASYRVSDIRIPDFLFAGSDLVTDIENLSFTGSAVVPIGEVASPVNDRRITVQPIVTADNNGSNAANGFGTAEQEAEIKRRVERVYSQAGIDVVFLPTKQWNNTFANGDGTGTRSVDDFRPIISRGDAAGFGSSDPSVIDLYFVSRVPGLGEPNLFSTGGGRGFVGISGSIVSVGDRATDLSFGRSAVTEVIAHEIGHNLGLLHTEEASLLSPIVNGEVRIIQSQIDQARRSSLTRSISGGGGNASTAGVNAAVAGNSNPELVEISDGHIHFQGDGHDHSGDFGGCDCGVCGFCTGLNLA